MTKRIINRRAALTGGAAIAASASLPVLNATPDDTHLVALVDRARRILDESSRAEDAALTARKAGAPNADWLAVQAAILRGRLDALYAAIPATPARTTKGMLAKLRLYFTDDEYAAASAGTFEPGGTDEAVLASLVRDLERGQS